MNEEEKNLMKTITLNRIKRRLCHEMSVRERKRLEKALKKMAEIYEGEDDLCVL